MSPEEALVERIACMLYEPRAAQDDCPPLGERLIEAIDRLLRRVHALEKSEDELRMLRADWAPVVNAAVLQSLSLAATEGDHAEWQRRCADTERAARMLTKAQQQAAEP